MLKGSEKFIIQVTGTGVAIRSSEGPELHFTASEAMMLLDILKHEENGLRRMATEASPLPMRICMTKESENP